MRFRMLAVIAAIAAVAGSASPALASRPPEARGLAAGQLTAQIRYTTGGIPHILAHNWADLGFGYGYAFAKDNICTMANGYTTVEAQRSRYFGPDGSYIDRGGLENNLESDIFWQQIIDSHIVQHLEQGLNADERQTEEGYVKGYNSYLAHVGGAKGVPDPTCRGKSWVKPITLSDSYLLFYQDMLEQSSGKVIRGITEAAPPTAAQATHQAAASPARTARALAAAWRAHTSTLGSNAVAIGAAGTRDHLGLLLANPHQPWFGTGRFYQAQLTIPGKINVTGASLYGIPLVLVGHNENVAWSHTTSTAWRFTPFQLTLVQGHPTEYLQNGKAVAMTPRTVTVLARQPNGTLAPVTHTLWWTRYGPVFNNFEGIPLQWTNTTAFAFANNLARAANTWFGFARASSTQQILSILKKYQGIPWANTIATDRAGLALYADIGAIPHVTNAEANRCDTPRGKLTFQSLALPILNGATTSCDWGNDPGAAVPGIFGPSHEPYLLRHDYVTNSNDSYWLANPHQPLTGFAQIISGPGTEASARTLRTRIGLLQVQARIDGTDGQGPPGFTVPAMRNLDLSDIDYAAQLTLFALVHLCNQFQGAGGTAPTTGGGTVPLGDACTTLAHWNMRWDAGQRGAVLFGEFWNHATASPTSPFSHPFEPAHPVTTPFGLNTAIPTVRNALGDAIQALHNAHIPIDTTLGAVQFVSYHGSHITLPGGPGDPDGIYNAIYENTEPGDSLTAPDTGSSFIQVVTWPRHGSCPDADTILTYSESSNPASPHFADQTKLFSKKQFLPDRFCPAQIAADPKLQVTTVPAG